jgi:putative multiple sugar transport system substrate-binding protein
MKKLLIVLLILAVAGTVFAGGDAKGGAATSGGGTKAAGKTFIGIAMPETTVLRWVGDGNKLKDEAIKAGYDAEVQWANGDQPTQNQQVQSYITQGAKVLIIGCLNDGVGSVVEEAARSGVQVIAYDRIIQNTTNYTAYITFNNYKVGTLQGQAIEKALDLKNATSAKPKYITLFAGSPTDANANFFFQGAMDVLNPYIDKGVLKVVGPYPKHYSDTNNFQRIATEGWLNEKAKQRMENLLNNDARNVTLDAVLAPNDGLGRAIIEACKADAKYRSKLPVVTGQDAEFPSALAIKNGEQYMTVFKDTAKLAEAAIKLADAFAKGNTSPDIPGAVKIYDSGDLKGIADVTPNNLNDNKYVHTWLLDPILVTKENLNVPVDAGFYEAAQASQLK